MANLVKGLTLSPVTSKIRVLYNHNNYGNIYPFGLPGRAKLIVQGQELSVAGIWGAMGVDLLPDEVIQGSVRIDFSNYQPNLDDPMYLAGVPLVAKLQSDLRVSHWLPILQPTDSNSSTPSIIPSRGSYVAANSVIILPENASLSGEVSITRILGNHTLYIDFISLNSHEYSYTLREFMSGKGRTSSSVEIWNPLTNLRLGLGIKVLESESQSKGLNYISTIKREGYSTLLSIRSKNFSRSVVIPSNTSDTLIITGIFTSNPLCPSSTLVLLKGISSRVDTLSTQLVDQDSGRTLVTFSALIDLSKLDIELELEFTVLTSMILKRGEANGVQYSTLQRSDAESFGQIILTSSPLNGGLYMTYSSQFQTTEDEIKGFSRSLGNCITLNTLMHYRAKVGDLYSGYSRPVGYTVFTPDIVGQNFRYSFTNEDPILYSTDIETRAAFTGVVLDISTDADINTEWNEVSEQRPIVCIPNTSCAISLISGLREAEFIVSPNEIILDNEIDEKQYVIKETSIQLPN